MQRLRLSFVASAWLVVACSGSTARTETSWPERPTPSYPAPSEEEPAAPPAPAGEPVPAPDAPTARGPAHSPLAGEHARAQVTSRLRGKATYYADSLAGRPTASGEPYDPTLFTAAHKKLPFGTILRVTRVDGGQTTYVKVNDRGPFGPADRILDLSRAAAEELEMMRAGVVAIRVEVLARKKEPPASR